MATETPQRPRYICRQMLTDPDGFRARCMVLYGTEHSHHDYTARESVEMGNQLEATVQQLAAAGIAVDPETGEEIR